MFNYQGIILNLPCAFIFNMPIIERAFTDMKMNVSNIHEALMHITTRLMRIHLSSK